MKIVDLYSYDSSVYALDCHSLDLEGTSANILSCSVPVGGQSEAHNHFESEIFIFVSGEGEVTDGKTTQKVRPGHAVEFAGLENHIITNTSTDQPLKLISVYWPNSVPAGSIVPLEKVLIFSTPPTPNGDLHLGHLSGPYVAADMIRRASLMFGAQAVHITGRDDNQSYVVTRAIKDILTPEAVADSFATMIRLTLTRANVPLDFFIEPDRNGPYAAFVQNGIQRLVEAGWIVEKEEGALFDTDGRYLHEAFVSGKCPHCGETSDGNACEACGRPNACIDLVGPKSKLTGASPRVRPQKRLFFRMSAFKDTLSQYVRTASMSAHVLDLCLGMLDDGLPDICISHPGTWGIPHTADLYQDHIVYVWFEMAFGYLWGAAKSNPVESEDLLEKAKSVYANWDVVHCYGFDNAYYHTLLFPAVYIALGITPPSAHVINELLDLDGSKFSTSRNHLIWSRDLLDCIPGDYVRFAVAFNRPEGVREDFSLSGCIDILNDLFPGKLTRWAKSVAARLQALGDVTPEPGAWLAEQTRYHRLLLSTAAELDTALQVKTFSARGVAVALHDFISEGERFNRTQERMFSGGHASSHNYRRTAVALDLLGLKLVARAARVIMPGLACELESILQLNSPSAGSAIDFIASGKHLNFAEPLTLPKADTRNLKST